jgi:hypothetical protein
VHSRPAWMLISKARLQRRRISQDFLIVLFYCTNAHQGAGSDMRPGYAADRSCPVEVEAACTHVNLRKTLSESSANVAHVLRCCVRCRLPRLVVDFPRSWSFSPSPQVPSANGLPQYEQMSSDSIRADITIHVYCVRRRFELFTIGRSPAWRCRYCYRHNQRASLSCTMPNNADS